jgi:hypothetical protein
VILPWEGLPSAPRAPCPEGREKCCWMPFSLVLLGFGPLVDHWGVGFGPWWTEKIGLYTYYAFRFALIGIRSSCFPCLKIMIENSLQVTRTNSFNSNRIPNKCYVTYMIYPFLANARMVMIMFHLFVVVE